VLVVPQVSNVDIKNSINEMENSYESNEIYYYGATPHIVTPHGLAGNFVGTFKPTNLHKVTSY
jgi:hypothetical protein